MDNPFIECLSIVTQNGEFISPEALDESTKNKFRQEVLKYSREELLEGFRQCTKAVIAHYADSKKLQHSIRAEISEEIARIYRDSYPKQEPNTIIEGAAHIPLLTEAELMHILFGRVAINSAMGRANLAFTRARIYDLLFKQMDTLAKQGSLTEGLQDFAHVSQQLFALQSFYIAEIDNPHSALQMDPEFDLQGQLPFNLSSYESFYESMSTSEMLNLDFFSKLKEQPVISRFSEDVYNPALFDGFNSDQIATLLLEEVEPLRVSRDANYLLNEFLKRNPQRAWDTLAYLENHYPQDISISPKIPFIRERIYRVVISKAIENITNSNDYKTLPVKEQQKIDSDIGKFQTKVTEVFDKHRTEPSPEKLYALIKKTVHSSFSNRDFAKRLLADIAMVVLCFAMVGFGIGIGRKLAGTSFFFSNNKTNRQKALEKEVDALFKPRDPG